MLFPKIAVLCPVVKNPAKIAAMIDNYYHFHGPHGFHILHRAILAEDDVDDFKKYLTTPADVYINKDSWSTSYSSTFGAILSNTQFLRENFHGEYSHVYIHTDGDLLVSGDLITTICQSGNGFGNHALDENWMHFNSSREDEHINDLFKILNLSSSDLRYGRQEGSYFEATLWNKIIDIALQIYSRESFTPKTLSWPTEEVFLPTVARWLLGESGPTSRNIVLTKDVVVRNTANVREHENNVIQRDDIMQVLKSADEQRCIGMKWFSPTIDHPARLLVKQLISKRAITFFP